MANSNRVTVATFSEIIGKTLNEYRDDVVRKVDSASKEAVEQLVKTTKRTAPKDTGAFRRHIAMKEQVITHGYNKKYIWYVKAPHHRLTHLLVHGHAKADGGRVPGDPFLENALNEVLPAYEKAVEEAVKND